MFMTWIRIWILIHFFPVKVQDPDPHPNQMENTKISIKGIVHIFEEKNIEDDLGVCAFCVTLHFNGGMSYS